MIFEERLLDFRRVTGVRMRLCRQLQPPPFLLSPYALRPNPGVINTNSATMLPLANFKGRLSMRLIAAVGVAWFAVSSLMAQTLDSNYKALREAAPAESFLIENLTLERDVAQFTLRTGTVTFLTPVQDKRMLAVFRGEGTFEFTPATVIDRNYVTKLAGQEKPNVGFQRMLLAFSDSTYDEIKKTGKTVAVDTEAASVLADLRKR